MTENNYPTVRELRTIQNWDYQDSDGLIRYVAGLWAYPERVNGDKVTTEDGRKERIWTFSTGGWSGNEDLIDALRKNTMFWTTCWYMSKRGGYYEFRILGG